MSKLKFQHDLYERDKRVVTSASIVSTAIGQEPSADVNVVDGDMQFNFTFPIQQQAKVDWDANSGKSQILNKPLWYDTTANWDLQRNLISKVNNYYVYTDYRTKEVNGENINIPGVKIGDGTTYLIDLPFIDQNPEIIQHIQNQIIHITAAERANWNDKVTAYMSLNDNELLILSKE